MINKIVFVNQSSGYLMYDILDQFQDDFEERILISGIRPIISNENSDKITFKKIIPYYKKNYFLRLISWFVGCIQIYWLLVTKYRNAYVFFVSNPPIVVFIPFLISNKFSFLVYDIYPDTLIKVNKLKITSWISRIWQSTNRKVYAKADIVFTISEAMKNVLKKYVSEAKLQVISLWANSFEHQVILKSNNQFLEQQNLRDKFIILYSGNLGATHDVEVLLEIARSCTNPMIFFLIIGNGEKEELIRQGIKDYNLENCRLLPLQPVEKFPYVISGADICVVATGRGASDLSIPSKTFNIIAAKKPLLCITDKDSELDKLVKKYEIGKSFMVGEIEGMNNFIQQLYTNKKYYTEMVEKLEIASNYFDKNIASGYRKILPFIN